MALDLIVESGGELVDFKPYVASMSDQGTVAFTSMLEDGGSGVFLHDGALRTLVRHGPDEPAVASHPAHEGNRFCYYAGGSLFVDGTRLASDAVVGPLGPTMNDSGLIALRATFDGEARIAVAGSSGIAPVARAVDGIAGFEGLPSIARDGAVVYRTAGDADGEPQTICRGAQGRAETLVATGDELVSLGRFPCSSPEGLVAFTATTASGAAGAYVHDGSSSRCVVAGLGRFSSFRGALIATGGELVYFATPEGGTLTIYREPSRAVLAIGEPLAGSEVAEFALNPASINGAGQIAIRVSLRDGRQLIAVDSP